MDSIIYIYVQTHSEWSLGSRFRECPSSYYWRKRCLFDIVWQYLRARPVIKININVPPVHPWLWYMIHGYCDRHHFTCCVGKITRKNESFRCMIIPVCETFPISDLNGFCHIWGIYAGFDNFLNFPSLQYKVTTQMKEIASVVIIACLVYTCYLKMLCLYVLGQNCLHLTFKTFWVVTPTPVNMRNK